MAGETAHWPNFFVAGAPKAGTTALYEFLCQHPQIYMSPIKEPTFFARDDIATWRWREDAKRSVEKYRASLAEYLDGPMDRRIYWRLVLEEEQYLRLFRGARGYRAVGEASVTYFWMPGVARAMAARVPHARLVFVLRDPADRAFSQYLSRVYNREGSFREHFLAGMNPEDRLSTWLEGGRYATNLSRFFEHFPREQIRVYLYEEYRRDPGAMLRDLFGFLDVDPDHPIDTSRRHNAPAVPRFHLLHRARRALLGRRKLMELVPAGMRPTLRRIYHRPRTRVSMDPADRRLAIEYYREEILRTAQMLGRDLSAWLEDREEGRGKREG